MKTTQNYGLRKPEPTDFYNVDDFNFNADVIDTELFAVKQKADQTESDLASHLNDDAYEAHKGVTLLDADIVIGVGPGGDFATIKEALKYLSRYYPEYKNAGIRAEIRLLSGFVMEEQVFVRNIDLSWVTISSVDAEVVINRSALSNGIFQSHSPAFGIYNGVGPVINVLFNMDDSGPSTLRHGIYLYNSKIMVMPTKGVKNAGEIGLYVAFGSHAHALGANFSGAKSHCVYALATSSILAQSVIADNAGDSGIAAQDASIINAREASAKNATKYGIWSNNGSLISAYSVLCNNAGVNGLRATDMSIISANLANARKQDGVDSQQDIFVLNGSLINAVSAQGGTNITPNTITVNGIIYK